MKEFQTSFRILEYTWKRASYRTSMKENFLLANRKTFLCLYHLLQSKDGQRKMDPQRERDSWSSIVDQYTGREEVKQKWNSANLIKAKPKRDPIKNTQDLQD